MLNGIKILSGTAGAKLADQICTYLSIKRTRATVGRFNDGEVKVQILEDVRDADVFVINPTNPPAENFLEMAFLAKAAHGSSAGRVTLVPSYLGYNRQDRKDRPRVPISALFMIKMLVGSAADRAILLDLHNESTAGYFEPMVVDHLFASAMSVPYLKELLKHPFVVASPDRGGGPRASAYVSRLDQSDFVMFSKIRSKDGAVDKDSIKIIGDVRGKNVLLVDDMVDSGGTLIADAKAAKNAGAKNVYAFATHAIFSKDAVARLDASCIKELIVTDTIYHPQNKLKTKRLKLMVLSVAPLLAEAIRRTHDGESLSALIL